MRYPEYTTDADFPTLIEVLDAQGSLREYHVGCDRTNDILRVLSNVSGSKRLPLICRKQVLDPEFVQEIPTAPRNDRRGSIPRFLVVDLDTFESFVVD